MYNRYIRNDNGSYTRIPEEESRQLTGDPQPAASRQPGGGPPQEEGPPSGPMAGRPQTVRRPERDQTTEVLDQGTRRRTGPGREDALLTALPASCAISWTSCTWTMWIPAI